MPALSTSPTLAPPPSFRPPLPLAPGALRPLAGPRQVANVAPCRQTRISPITLVVNRFSVDKFVAQDVHHLLRSKRTVRTPFFGKSTRTSVINPNPKIVISTATVTDLGTCSVSAVHVCPEWVSTYATTCVLLVQPHTTSIRLHLHLACSPLQPLMPSVETTKSATSIPAHTIMIPVPLCTQRSIIAPAHTIMIPDP